MPGTVEAGRLQCSDEERAFSTGQGSTLVLGLQLVLGLHASVSLSAKGDKHLCLVPAAAHDPVSQELSVLGSSCHSFSFPSPPGAGGTGLEEGLTGHVKGGPPHQAVSSEGPL